MVVKPTKFLCRIEPKLLHSGQDALFNLEPSNMKTHCLDQIGLLLGHGSVNNPH
jgi:hypothetical protein